MLLAHEIRWSIESGRRYFGVMLGDEPYKYSYGPRERTVLAVTVGNPQLRSRATLGLSRMRRSLLPAGLQIPPSAAGPKAALLARCARRGNSVPRARGGRPHKQ
jgi:CelD/BcsL family acetyltransferase involved in cellulose biosynthesis